MKVVLIVILFMVAGIRAEAQNANHFLAPAYSGRIPLIQDLRVYKNLCNQDSNQALINLEGFIPHIKLDIRYATKNNFMHARMYPLAKAYLRRPAAKALKKISQDLEKMGIGLLIYDAYRPYAITVKFYEMVGDSNFVASPRTGSRHNRGCAIDLGLYDLKTGIPLEMPTGFDSFTKQASANYPDLPPLALKDRALLANMMSQYDFHVMGTEWWHFDYKDWAKYPVLDISFEKLKQIH